MYKKSNYRLFINFSSIVRFSKYLCQGVPYKAESWNIWSYEKYLSKHLFLDICHLAFKNIYISKEYRSQQLITACAQWKLLLKSLEEGSVLSNVINSISSWAFLCTLD